MWASAKVAAAKTFKVGATCAKWGVILHCTLEYLGDFVIVSAEIVTTVTRALKLVSFNYSIVNVFE